jgi:hypothetical protein
MHTHRVVRTRLYLDETVHRRLQGLARRQGRTIVGVLLDSDVVIAPPGSGSGR